MIRVLVVVVAAVVVRGPLKFGWWMLDGIGSPGVAWCR